MTREELKKRVNYQYQLMTFGLGMADDQQNDPVWLDFAQRLIEMGAEMAKDTNLQLGGSCH